MITETVEFTKEQMNELNDLYLKVKNLRLFPPTEEQVRATGSFLGKKIFITSHPLKKSKKRLKHKIKHQVARRAQMTQAMNEHAQSLWDYSISNPKSRFKRMPRNSIQTMSLRRRIL